MGMDNSRTNLSRRTILKSGAVVAASNGLAGCVTDLGSSGEFPSDDITIVTLGSGSLFDVWSRALEEYLPEHLRGEPNVIVENIPTGGGVQAGIETYTADADGYTVGTLNIPGNLQAQMLFNADYDLQEIDWVSRVARYPYVLVVEPDSDYESVDDLAAADEVLFSIVEPGASDALATALANQEYGIDAEYVSGYDQGLDATNAVERGDVDARYQVGPMITDRIEAGDVEPILVVDTEEQSYAPEVPTVADDGNEHLSDFGLQVFVGGPGGIDDDRLEILKDGFQETLNSDEMSEWAEEAGPPGQGLNPATADECEEIIKSQESQISESREYLKSEIV